MTVPIAMGSANAINFQPTGGDKAAITGDFVITGDEVTPMIKTLRANGIEVTAIQPDADRAAASSSTSRRRTTH